MRKIPEVMDLSKPTSLPAATIGLDLGVRRSHVCVLDQAGVVLERVVVDSTAPAMEAAFAPRRGATIVIEAGGHSPWVSRLLAGLGLRVIVANPNQLALITKSHRKTDRADAELLARLGRADLALLRPVEHRSAAMKAHLEMLKARDTVVRCRTMQVNRRWRGLCGSTERVHGEFIRASATTQSRPTTCASARCVHPMRSRTCVVPQMPALTRRPNEAAHGP